MSIETHGSVMRLNVWAGRSIVAIALLHIVFFAVEAWEFIPGWFTGDLWSPASMSESHGYFWALAGGFAVPLLLLGMLIARHQGPVPGYVTWSILGWVVLCSLLVEPSGFPLGLVPAGLLVAAEVGQKRGGRLSMNARTPSA